VEKRASDALSSVKAAATESREQLQSRIDQAQVDMDRVRLFWSDGRSLIQSCR
jgi:hypothetical protein